MLKNIPKIIPPDLLHALSAMGHGDQITIADAHFPAYSCARDNIINTPIRLDNTTVSDILRAILPLFPLDNFADDSASYMQMVDTPQQIPEAVQEFQTIINDCAENPCAVTAIERFAFYDVAKTAFVTVQSGDLRPYGNIILRKGLVF